MGDQLEKETLPGTQLNFKGAEKILSLVRDKYGS
jgi:hypothetical protein